MNPTKRRLSGFLSVLAFATDVMRYLILVLALDILPSIGNAMVITQQDWDALPGSPWQFGNWAGSAVIDSSAGSPSGGGAMKFTMPSGVQGNGDIFGEASYYPAATYNEIWIGSWYKFSSGYVWHPIGNKMSYFYCQPDGGSNDHLTTYGNVVFFNESHVWGNGGYDVYTSYQLQTGRWYWLQWHIILNNPGKYDGLFEAYISDPVTGVTTRAAADNMFAIRGPTAGPGFSRFFFGIIYGGSGTMNVPTQSMWIDHTVIATTQVETNMLGGTPPSPSDALVPAAPRGLKIL